LLTSLMRIEVELLIRHLLDTPRMQYNLGIHLFSLLMVVTSTTKPIFTRWVWPITVEVELNNIVI
jgi:hypothetical protein